MSSTIFGSDDSSEWHVPNEIFCTVLYRGTSVGAERARSASETEVGWVESLESTLDDQRHPESPIQTYSPDVTIDELFASGDELAFWANVFHEAALRERQRPCDTDEGAVERSARLIWATYGLAKFLRHEARVRGAMPAW